MRAFFLASVGGGGPVNLVLLGGTTTEANVKLRDIAVTLGLFAVSFFVVERAQSALHNWLMRASGLEAGPSNAWPPLLLGWAVGIVVFVAVGALLAWALRAERIVPWAVAFGAAYGVVRFALYTVHSWPPGDQFPFLMLWGALVLAPLIGTVLGAVGFRQLRSTSHVPPPSAA